MDSFSELCSEGCDFNRVANKSPCETGSILTNHVTAIVKESKIKPALTKLHAGLKEEQDLFSMIRKVNYLSEWDISEDYRITSPLAIAQKPVMILNDVTLVAQCSPSKLHLLKVLARTWHGPVSVSVFCEMKDVAPTLLIIAKLRQCHSNIANYVMFHLVTYRGSGTLKNLRIATEDCSSLDLLEESQSKLQNYNSLIQYPINLLRNIARRGVSTRFFLLVDIDMVPNPALRKDFVDLASKTTMDDKTAYIVPAFELSVRTPLPITKIEVKEFLERSLLRQFYGELCEKCHNCIKYSEWFQLPQQLGLRPAYNITWTDPCEPFYIATKHVPLYDEAFKQYGFNRISQVCELHIAGHQFVVLDNAFLTHIGFKTADSFHENKQVEQVMNRQIYRKFKQKLKIKYPTSSRRC